MRESRERGRFAYAGIAGKHVSEESKEKKHQKKDYAIRKHNAAYKP